MVHLQEMAKKGQQTTILKINQRLPHFLRAPCDLQISYRVEAKEEEYLIHLHVRGTLQLQCQRCLDEYPLAYDNQTVIALCPSDERAEQLLEYYECAIFTKDLPNLEDLVIDELHLYVPPVHPQLNQCSSKINQFLSGKANFIDI